MSRPVGRWRRLLPRFALGGLALGWSLALAAAEEIALVGEERLTGTELGQPAGNSSERASHTLHLTLVVLEATGWSRDEVVAAIIEVAGLLTQCGIGLAGADLLRVSTPERFHDFHTPAARELARRLAPGRPTLYFVRDTRQQPAFDAEAIGRGNSRTRPELADSVWVTRAAPDVGIVLAHELVHVLANSGEHVDLPGNLMRNASAPANRTLTAAQCARLRTVGMRHGLLHPAASG